MIAQRQLGQGQIIEKVAQVARPNGRSFDCLQGFAANLLDPFKLFQARQDIGFRHACRKNLEWRAGFFGDLHQLIGVCQGVE